MSIETDQPEAGTHSGLVTLGGLATLGHEAIELRSALESRFLGWAHASGARQVLYPPLIDVAALAELDYFRNFPHLAVLGTPLTEDAMESSYGTAAESLAGNFTVVPARDLADAVHALPSAACFNVYLSLRGVRLSHAYRVTTGCNCFRREKEFNNTRLLSFYMREIVCLGDRDEVLEQITDVKKVVLDFAVKLGLPLRVQPASDPFFEMGGSRALIQKIFPVKEEFIYLGDTGEIAVASVNFHRNFFGERCDIRLPDGTAAFSGCVAFGLERWMAVLGEHFGQPLPGLARRVRQAGTDRPMAQPTTGGLS